jgi:hypothetical protein
MNQSAMNTNTCGFILAGLFAVAAPIHASDLDLFGGGGGASSVGPYSLRDTLGQPVAGLSSINHVQVEAGFWPGVNAAPTPGTDSLVRATHLTAKIRLSTLLSNDSDPDGDPLTLIALDTTSTEGGTILLDNGWVCYSPPTGFNGADTFTYTLSDDEGNLAVNTVTVVMEGANNGPTRNIIAIATLPSGHKLVSFIGIAGRTYRIEWTADLASPSWQTLTTQVAGTNGCFEYEDTTEPLPAQRFYRAVCY